MRTFKHLTLEERENLYAWRESGVSFRSIAKRLGRNVGSITREWKWRTKYGKKYLPCLAQKRADCLAAKQRAKAPLKEPLIFLYVREHLRDPYRWSPETIAGRLPMDHPGYSIDDETIYRYVYGKKQKRMKLWNDLTLHRKRRMKRYGRKVKSHGKIVGVIPIDRRPIIVHERKRVGDWESDNMEGVKSDRMSLSVTVDRVDKVARLRLLADHTAETKLKAVSNQIRKEPKECQHTLTVDNGPENSFLSHVGLPVYTCTPYHSWEKGTVENTIGRIRRNIPKGTSIDGIREEEVVALEWSMNTTPRKSLGFLTPYEMRERMLTASRTL